MSINRRHFIGGILVCGCGATNGLAGERMRLRSGCYFGQAPELPATFKQSSGISKYDRSVKGAVYSLNWIIGRQIAAAVMFMKENNALYNPAHNIIAVGVPLLDNIQGHDFDLKVTCILAHEVAHIFQSEESYFDLAQTDTTIRRNELMADHFAGCIIAFLVNEGRKIDRGKIFDRKASVESAFKLMFSRGDYNFTNPNHHGTPSERLEAATWGYEVAFEVAGGNPVGDISAAIMDTARFGRR